MDIYKNRWKFLLVSILNTMIFLSGNVLNKKLHNYKIYPSDISFSIIFGILYGFLVAYLIMVYFGQQKETVELDFEVQASLEQLEAFNEELIAQNDELESFANIISDKEKELKEIINLSPMSIMIKNYDGKYLLCNKAYSNLLGVDINDIEGRNQNEIELFDKIKLNRLVYTDHRVIDENITYEYVEKIVINGEELYFKVHKIPIELSEDSKEILVIAQDITDLENMKNEIEEKNKILIKDNVELVRLNDETARLANDFERMIKIITGALEYENNNEYLENIFELSLDFVPSAESGVVFLLNDDNEIEFIKEHKKSFNINHIKEMMLMMPVKNEVGIIKNIDSNLINIGFYYGSKLVGGMSFYRKNDNGIFSEYDGRLLKSISVLVNNYYTNKKIIENKNNTQNSIIISLVKMLELFDSYTKGHSENVAILSKKLAVKIGIEDVDSAYWAGMVHDIGKILVDRNILNKNTKLNFKEYETIKMHPYWGYEVLKKSDELKDIAEYVLYHHERYDGTGYPYGLKGEDIPEISQIISVVDSYDTMISKRSYKEPLTIEEAIIELNSMKGTQFSPKMVDVFVNEILCDNNLLQEIVN